MNEMRSLTRNVSCHAGVRALRRGLHAVAALLFASTPAIGADTVYKVVQPDGSVTYSDQPPAAGTSTRLEFRNLPATPLSESALRFRAEIEKSLKSRAAALKEPQAGELRLFTASWCPHCKRAKAHLAARNVRFAEYDIDTPDGMAAFIQASGRSVPLLVSSSGRVQGYSEGKYDQFLSASGSR
jgi:glutaredoxin